MPTPGTYWDEVLDDFFGVMHMPLVRGRTFTHQDDTLSAPVVVVNEAFGRLLWPGQNAIGHRLRFVTDTVDKWWTIVGVVHDARYNEITGPPRPTVFFPYRQDYNYPWLVVRTPGDPTRATDLLEQTIEAVDPGFGIGRSVTVPDLLDARLARPRALAALLTALAGTALFLAAIGLFGVLSAYVRERRRGMALRSALGATPGQIRSLVLAQVLTVAAAGITCGLPLALGGARVLRASLADVVPADLLTIVGIVVVLLAVVVVATLGPMIRATRIEARTALATD